MSRRPNALSPEQKEYYRNRYTSQYKDDEVNKMIETVNKQQKSILERLQTAGYKDAKARTQLQRDLYDYKYTLSALGALGIDVSGGKKLSEQFDKIASEQDKMFSPFKDEDSYMNALYSSKYRGKSVSFVDDVINKRKNNVSSLDDKEYNWLVSNRDSFMTKNELLSEIGTLEGNSQQLKQDKWLNRFDYAGNLIGGAIAGDTSRMRAYDTAPETAEIENNARLKKLKELLAGKDDFDAESAYKKADEKNLWDVITTDYTYADYLNDKDSKNIYGAEAVRRRDEENFKIIENNSDTFAKDYSEVINIISNKKLASDLASTSIGGSLANVFNDSERSEQIFSTDPDIQKIVKKWSDMGYDFKSLYDSYERKTNTDYAATIKGDIAEYTKEHPVLGNITSIGTNLIGGISALPSALKTGIEELTSDDIVTLDTNAPEWALKNVTDSIRDTTSQMISEKNEGIKGEFLNFLYQTGMSIADMGAATLVSGMNPTGMQIIMGTNAAADSIKTVTEKGGSIDEALLTGLTSGIFEALFEKVSIDNLFRTATSDTGRKLIYNFVRGFLSEGSEELATDIANNFADALINGNNSEFNNSVYNYMAEGKTAAEARSLAMVDTMKQMGLSFAGGALSGGLVSGVGGGINLMSANSQYSRAGNEIINNGNVDSVMQLADEIVKNQHNEDVAYDLDAIEKYQKGIENKTFRTSGNADINTAVENRLSEFGVTDSNVVNRVTDAFVKDTEFRKTGKATVDKYASRVLSELRSSENATGRENFTNEWASPVVDKARTDAKTAAADKYRARDIGRLAKNVQNAIINSTQENVDAEIKKGIQTRVEYLGVDKSTSKTAADIVFKAFMGDKLTTAQHRILEKNQIVKRVYNELKAADEVGINNDNSWVSPVLENAGILRAVQNVKLSSITGSKENTVTGDGVIDDVKTFDSDVKTTPSIINGTENFDSFVENVRSESMTTGVVKKYSKTEIDNKTAGQIAVLDAYGRKHGLSFIVVDSIGEGDTRANGTYVGENKVLISLDAEGGALLSVAGHEVYHYIARNNKLGADSIKAFVLDKLKNNANYDYEFEFNKLVKSYGTENVDEIEEEMVANAMFELLSDEEVINDLAKENPSLLEKIIAAIKDFIKELKEMAKKLPWAEVAVFEEDIQSLETIKAMAEAALGNIRENSKNAENSNNDNKSEENVIKSEINVNKTETTVDINAAKVNNTGNKNEKTETKNTAEEDGVIKYNFKTNQIYPGISDADRAEVLRNTVISIAQYTGNDELNGKNVMMLKSTYRKKAREILIELSEKFQIFDSKYSNENIELEFEYSRNSLKESVNKQGDISTDFYDFAKMLYIFDDVIKNAVPIEVHTDKYEGTKRANPNLKYDYVLLSAFSDGEYIIPVEFHIKEFKENVKEPNKLYVSITLGKIKIENKVIAQVAENYINNNQWQSARLFSEISIPQLVEKINPEYGNFYKYIPSELLDEEQIKSKTVAVEDEKYKLAVMRGEDVSDILSRKALEKGYDTDTSWRMDHKAPNAKYDVCITDIDRCYGGDGSIYSPKAAYYYGDGRSYDQKAINAIKKARKSPETLISIYRAVPSNIKDTRVRNGDWVSIDKEYAEEHGWRMFDDDYRIIENKVPAKYLYTDGNSIHEFGYDNGNYNELYKNTENNVKLNEVTYDDKGNLIPLSKRFDEDNPDIRFSLQETAQAGEVKEKLIKENDNLRVANTLLKKEMKLTQGRMLSLDNTRLIARQLTEQYSSDYDRELLARQIYNIFNHYDETGDYDYLINYLATIGKRVVARSSAVDSTLYEDYEDCRKWVRNMEFTLPEQVLKQLNENYDGQFVKKTFGRMRYVSRATHPDAPFLSQIYSELANEYPNFFSIEDNEYEQPMRLIEFWEKIQPTVYNPVNEMGYATEDDAAVGFAFDVFNAYSKADKLETFADKKKKEIENIHKEYDRNLERAKQKLRKNRDDKVAETRKYYQNMMREQRFERQMTKKKQAMHKDIVVKVKRLGTMLTKPTDNKHIPEHLKELTTKFVNIFSNDSIIFDDNAMIAIKDMYHDIIDAKGDELANVQQYYDPDIYNYMVEFADIFRDIENGKRLAKLDATELFVLQSVVDHMHFIVMNESEIFVEGKKENFNKIVSDTVAELKTPKPDFIKKMFDLTSWNLTPYYFFKHIGGTFERLFKDLLDGQNNNGLKTAQAHEYIQKLNKKYRAYEWMNDEKKTIKVNNEVELTVNQALHIYAMAKREATSLQHSKHLTEGGIVFEDKNKSTEPITLSLDAQRILISKLSKSQIAYADEVCEYLSKDVAAWGNEASLKMHGYKKFNEKFYYPFHTPRNWKDTSDGNEQLNMPALLKNKSFTKGTKHGANTPVTVENFTDVTSNHIAEMISYNTMAQAQSTLYSLYRFKSSGVSVRSALEDAYGKSAVVYIKKLMNDISGGLTVDPSDNFATKMMGKFKKNAVAANLAVIAQQPMAIGRSMTYIDPKYFLTTSPKGGYEELKKYSGIAVIKEMGGFDTSSGKTAADYIMKTAPEDLKGKAKEFFKFRDSLYRDDKFAWAAGKADELTWSFIWQAVKKEVADKQKLRGEELLIESGKRFNEVIEATQVYDSVLSRSQIMRGGTWAKMATAFMGEPTKKINMLNYAFQSYVKDKNSENGKFLMRTIGGVMASAFLTAFAKSFISAGRDDDENKSFIEKYIPAFIGNLYSDISVLQGLPIVKDIVSLFQGYDVTRTDMSVVSDIVYTLTNIVDVIQKVNSGEFYALSEDERHEKIRRAVIDFFGTFGVLTDFPLENIIRDCSMLYRTVGNIFDEQVPTKDGLKYATLDGFIELFDNVVYNPLENLRVNEKDIINDILKGDAEAFADDWDKYEAYLIYNGKDEKKAFSAVRSDVKEQIKYKLLADRISKEEAEKYLIDYLGYDDGYWIVKEWLFYADEVNAEADWSKYMYLESAVLSGSDISDEVEALITHNTKEKNVQNKITSIIKEAFDNDEIDEATAQNLLDKYKGFAANQSFVTNTIESDKDVNRLVDKWAGNKDLPEGEYYTSFDSLDDAVISNMSIENACERLYELEYTDSEIRSHITQTIQTAYHDNELTKSEAVARLQKYNDLDYETAQEKILYWDFKADNPSSKLSEPAALKYLEAKQSGISLDTFTTYYEKKSECTGIKDDDGKTISGSKKEQIMKVIDALPLTSKQKDLLYFQNNWSESTLYEAPWH